MLELLRTVKSDGGDRECSAGGQARRPDAWRPAVTWRDLVSRKSEVYGGMMETMLANGGEEPTLFLWACDRYPSSASVPRADDPADGTW